MCKYSIESTPLTTAVAMYVSMLSTAATAATRLGETLRRPL